MTFDLFRVYAIRTVKSNRNEKSEEGEIPDESVLGSMTKLLAQILGPGWKQYKLELNDLFSSPVKRRGRTMYGYKCKY